MQWIALDNALPITCAEAVKQKKYLCPECGSWVQVRGGPHRQAHFFHLRSNNRCSQHKKTAEHLRLQIQLAFTIGSKDACMERAFPQIKRIADVAWESRKLIFEIQCSPITLQEVESRCRDYHSIGWELVWILSDRRFNKRKLSAAEAYLRECTCYFSNWKRRLIYDQWEILHNGYRTSKGPFIKIDPVSVVAHSPTDLPPAALPKCLQLRWQRWKLRAENDVLTRLLKNAFPQLSMIMRLEKKPTPLPIRNFLKNIYLLFLNKLLNKFSSNKPRAK